MQDEKNYYNSETFSPRNSKDCESNHSESDENKRQGNLIQNHSFENDMVFWTTNNARSGNTNPAEGTQVANLGSGVASLSQDVPLSKNNFHPLFLSFITYVSSVSSQLGVVGNLVVQVLWLEESHRRIGAGLSGFISTDVVDG